MTFGNHPAAAFRNLLVGGSAAALGLFAFAGLPELACVIAVGVALGASAAVPSVSPRWSALVALTVVVCAYVALAMSA